jgi:hypothetical protein
MFHPLREHGREIRQAKDEEDEMEVSDLASLGPKVNDNQVNSSAHVEKANDLLVARRQKHKGTHWSLDTSDSLCALKTLMLNHGWELYWQKRRVLPLAA